MIHSELLKSYQTVIAQYQDRLSKDASTIIDRGLVISDNQNIKDDKVVLLTGINPSYKENDRPESYSFCFHQQKMKARVGIGTKNTNSLVRQKNPMVICCQTILHISTSSHLEKLNNHCLRKFFKSLTISAMIFCQ